MAALSSGTAAIHLALILLGVERKDSFGTEFYFLWFFQSNLISRSHTNIEDSEVDTYNLDPDVLEFAIKDRIEKVKVKGCDHGTLVWNACQD